jgi:subtilisin family serine protease
MAKSFSSFRTALAGLALLGGLWLSPSLAAEPKKSASSPRRTAALARPKAVADSFDLRRRTDHLARLGVPAWQAAGIRGQGVKIAVLDSGFRGYRDFLGTALPDHVTVKSFRLDGNLEARDSQHGILCGEVLHALAPDAELLFANWEADRPEQFLEAVRWARAQGARVISCSVITPNWSDGEGGGPVHGALTRLLGQGTGPSDVLFFASAGNVADRHWSGGFHDGGAGFHEWRNHQIDNPLTPWGSERVSVELCCKPGARYDVSVYDQTTAAEVTHAVWQGVDAHPAAARFDPQPDHAYRVRVRLLGGTPTAFHLVALGAGLGCALARGSVSFPADGAEIVAVGAVDRDGQRMGYSACGPILSGPKPDLVATVPFPSLVRQQPFGGTSAAAPQAAALAALLWSSHPAWTAGQIRAALRTAARDLGPAGYDCETGYGLIHLPPPATANALGRTKASSQVGS